MLITCKQKHNQYCQGMARYVRINGTPSMVITKKNLLPQRDMAQCMLLGFDSRVWNKHHLPWQFNEDCYKAIEVFEGERNVKDLQALGDLVYNQPKEDS